MPLIIDSGFFTPLFRIFYYDVITLFDMIGLAVKPLSCEVKKCTKRKEMRKVNKKQNTDLLEQGNSVERHYRCEFCGMGFARMRHLTKLN